MEAALNTAGVTSRVGRVEDGNTVSDYDPEEARRRVSVGASIIPVEWKDEKINFIDTPGFFDFVGEVCQALRAADVALIIVSAKSGVEVGVENAWDMATEAGLPKIFFVNEMDDDNADFDKVVEELKQKFGKSIAPLQVPFKENGKFVGFVNAIKKEGRKFVNGRTEDCPVPGGVEGAAEDMHKMIEEAVAETNDDLMEKFFAEEPFTVEEITNGVKAGIKDGSVAPVLCGSALFNIGVRVLMNSILEYVPSAADIKPGYKAKNLRTDETAAVKIDESAPFSAFVFKTIADPYVGRLSIFKVMSGVLTRETALYNPKKDFTERIGHLYVMRGKEQIEVGEIRAGDIGALAKLANTSTSDTLCVKEHPVLFPDVEYPKSYYAMGIAPKGKGDEDKISQALSKIREEDKTIYTEINPETKQQVVYGAGDSHLDVLLRKLAVKYKIEAEYVPAIVPYRETIRGKSDVQGKHKKQSGGHGQYGDVKMRFEPASNPEVEYEFEQIVFGGSVPRQYFPAVEKGVQENCKAGPLAGYPVVGIKAILYDGSYHDVDSSEMAFKLATAIAFKDGFIKAKPALLEPIASVTIIVPDQYTGDIMGDMNKRRGRILGMEKHGAKQHIMAEAPMAEMFKYALDLRSMTQGRGSFKMKFERYEEAPGDVQNKVIEARRKEKEAEK
jgi:elongation factor G